MSRTGKKEILLPENVEVLIKQQNILVRGPKGILAHSLPSIICCCVDSENRKLQFQNPQVSRYSKALHGLTRALISNMIMGVSKGFSKTLKLLGVGYRARLDGKTLILNVGYSRPIQINPPAFVSIKIENQTSIIVSGIQKNVISEFVAKIRSIRPPEPYKGKGIMHNHEIINRKPGKTGK